VPLHDDPKLFEFLILEGMQAGLSWLTILRKRENFTKAFDNFDAEKIARYNEKKISELINNPEIVRNRLKIQATITNAIVFLDIQQKFNNFDAYIWQFTDGNPIKNTWKKIADIPANTPVSDAMSKDMKQRGFKFVGSTICYAFMQAVGMINDHTIDCFRYNQV